jgi:hypothetical protein
MTPNAPGFFAELRRFAQTRNPEPSANKRDQRSGVSHRLRTLDHSVVNIANVFAMLFG